ncbi:twin-arginine translocase subunit TatC [Teredinibacter sp. KSP-S5-2]|uniref:twin-arginine translocase subunit TatC n=1 Tax=Teredinibacter sp. KSP-S5-2 TaxID=3034506 RepID=UPI0039774A54
MTDKTPPFSGSQDAQPLVQHLIELRSRLIYSLISVVIVFIPLFTYANDVYEFVAAPLQKFLPEGSSMIATDVASPFLTPFKLCLFASVILAVPFIFYQLWLFVAPALYKSEKRIALPLFISSVVLFYMGMAFSYFVVFPLVFGFFTSVGPESVSVMTDISSYLNFVLKLFFAFGIAFEIPIATILLISAGILSADNLAAKRPYVIVACFVLGMLLTPPDVISQLLLAIPMWLLFESGLLFGRIMVKKKTTADN